MAKKGLNQANTLKSNNTSTTGYGIIYADEIIGFKRVATTDDLYTLKDWQLSATGDGSDAVGQLWYNESVSDFMQLQDWSKRHESTGWSIYKASTAKTATLANSIPTHTLWGQTFNGTQNVTGALSGVTNIYSDYNITHGITFGTASNSNITKLYEFGGTWEFYNAVQQPDKSYTNTKLVTLGNSNVFVKAVTAPSFIKDGSEYAEACLETEINSLFV